MRKALIVKNGDVRELNYYLSHDAVIEIYQLMGSNPPISKRSTRGISEKYDNDIITETMQAPAAVDQIFILLKDLPSTLPPYESVPWNLGGGYIEYVSQPMYAASTTARKTVTI